MSSRPAARPASLHVVVASVLVITTGPALLAVTAAPAAAAGATSPPQCGTAVVKVLDNTTAVAISLAGKPVVTSTLSVTGAGASLTDVDVLTSIAHTFSSDLDVTIMSPAGTIVTLTSDNGGVNDNVFYGTRWNDDADPGTPVPHDVNQLQVQDHTYANLTPVPNLLPEEALAAFTGENPNGVWTLTVADDNSGDGGSLDGWSLHLTSAPSAPRAVATSVSRSTPVSIIDGTPTVTSTVAVSGAVPFVADVNVLTHLRHSFNDDVDMSLTSPAGTIVTLTTDNGTSTDDVFNGTTWDDDADPGTQAPHSENPLQAHDHAYTNLLVVPTLLPEEALGAFVGEDPNGTWTMTVADDTDPESGVLTDWTLDLGLATCVPVPDRAVTGATATASGKQSAGKKRLAVVSTVASTAEPLTVSVTGVLTVGRKSSPLSTQQVSVAKGATATVTSVLDGAKRAVRKQHRKLLAKLRRGKSAAVVLTFTFTDAAKNVVSLSQTVQLKAPTKNKPH